MKKYEVAKLQLFWRKLLLKKITTPTGENPKIKYGKNCRGIVTNDMVRCSIRATEQLYIYDDLFGENKSPQTKGFWFCDPEGIRTPDPQLRRLLLYPAQLPDLYTILS